MKSPIFGPAYVSRSTNLADSRLVNFYPEVVETKQGKEVGALYGTPGLKLLTTIGNGPIREMHAVSTTEHLMVVSGSQLYEVVNFTEAPTLRGSLGPAGTAWSFDPATFAFTQITLPFSTVTSSLNANHVSIVDNRVTVGIFVGMSAAEQDGFVMINSPTDNKIWQSDLLDLTTFDPLNFAEASGHSDNVVAVEQIHREMMVIQQYNTEIWVNAGTSPFAFQRLDGAHIEVGCVAPGTVLQVGESLMWLAQNLAGDGVVVRLEGYNPRPVSTHHMTREFQSYDRMDDAIAYTYQQDGHQFYVLSFPSGDATWVYDVTGSALAGVPMWHQRASLQADGLFHRHWGASSVFFGGVNVASATLLPGKNVIGDYRNGNLYTYDYDTMTDNGTTIKRLRTWRAKAQATQQPERFSSLTIDTQTGINVPDGTSPLWVLRWSDDGGHNWSDERFVQAGPPGATAQRVKFNRLGSTRRNSGLDRIFELSTTDPFPAVIVGAELE